MNDGQSIVLDEPVPTDGEVLEDTGRDPEAQGDSNVEVSPIAVTDAGTLARLEAISGQIDKLIGSVDGLEKSLSKQQDQTRDAKETTTSTVLLVGRFAMVEGRERVGVWQAGFERRRFSFLACLPVAVGIRLARVWLVTP